MPRYDLNGKVALVTGGARGIGFETGRQLQLRGAAVVVVDLDADQAREAAARIGTRTLGIDADVTDRAAMRDAVAAAVERFGGLDVAIANAGVAQAELATARGIEAEEWERVVEIDLLGVWRTVRAALPQIAARRGHVVLIGSLYSFMNGVFNSPYAVSKAGIEALGRALRTELAPLGASAGVSYFGWVDTKLVQDVFAQEKADLASQLSPEWALRRIPPDEAAAALVRGIETRAPRTFAPGWWRYVSAFRGLLNPLLDRRFERDPQVAELVREVDAARP